MTMVELECGFQKATGNAKLGTLHWCYIGDHESKVVKTGLNWTQLISESEMRERHRAKGTLKASLRRNMET